MGTLVVKRLSCVFLQDLNDPLFLKRLLNNLYKYLKDYDNILLLGDFNMTPENTNL